MMASIVAGAMFVLIAVRCACVVNAMSWAARGRAWLAWELFSLSYCLLMAAAGIAAWSIIIGAGSLGAWLWLIASSGLIVFDRRRRVAT